MQSPELFEHFGKGTFHQDYRQKLGFFSDALKYVVENARALDFPPALVEKMRGLPAVLANKAIDIYNDNSGGFKVLNHGDFYTSNILFRYNSKGELQNCFFVSIFQINPFRPFGYKLTKIWVFFQNFQIFLSFNFNSILNIFF